VSAAVTERDLTDEDRQFVALGVELLAGGLTEPERFAKFIGSGPSASAIVSLAVRLAVAKRANVHTEPGPRDEDDDAVVSDVAAWLLAFGLTDAPVLLERLLMPGRGPGKAGQLLVLAEALAAKRRPQLAFSPLT
jgi:hypothetical protein